MEAPQRKGLNPQRTWLKEIVLPRRWVRELDRRAIEDYGIPSPVLMENAGRGAADLLEAQTIRGQVVVCCGKGNNAGDGFVLARHLDLRGYSVSVLLAFPGESLSGDALLNYQIAKKAGLPMTLIEETAAESQLVEVLCGADWIVDGLLGTGATGDPKPPLDRIIRAINVARRHGPRVFALDLPSGWDCDTGQPSKETIRADFTVTFAVFKPGFLLPQAEQCTGVVEVADIGVPRQLVLQVLEDYRKTDFSAATR